MPRYQERVRLDRLKEIEARIMSEISEARHVDMKKMLYWIYMRYGVHSNTAKEYLSSLETSGKFEIDWYNGLIVPVEEHASD